eukprot:7009716-Pyramimonas_sp.AAC.1
MHGAGTYRNESQLHPRHQPVATPRASIASTSVPVTSALAPSASAPVPVVSAPDDATGTGCYCGDTNSKERRIGRS